MKQSLNILVVGGKSHLSRLNDCSCWHHSGNVPSHSSATSTLSSNSLVILSKHSFDLPQSLFATGRDPHPKHCFISGLQQQEFVNLRRELTKYSKRLLSYVSTKSKEEAQPLLFRATLKGG
jgi:hypothetical protein